MKLWIPVVGFLIVAIERKTLLRRLRDAGEQYPSLTPQALTNMDRLGAAYLSTLIGMGACMIFAVVMIVVASA